MSLYDGTFKRFGGVWLLVTSDHDLSELLYSYTLHLAVHAFCSIVCRPTMLE